MSKPAPAPTPAPDPTPAPEPTPTPAPEPTPTPEPAPKPKASEKTFTKAEMEAANAKAVADALKKAEEEKDLSDLEKAQNRTKELESQIRLRDAKESVSEALTKAGAKSPGLIFEALKGQLEFDDKGGLKNLDSLVNNFKSSYPEQFGEAKPDQTIDGGAGQGSSGDKLTKEKLAAMTPQEVAALDWAEVRKVLSAK